MLPDTPDVEQVLTGPDGVLSALRPGTVIVDMSSISPAATRRHGGGGGGEGRRDARRAGQRRRHRRHQRDAVDHGGRRRGGVRLVSGRCSTAWGTPSASSSSASRAPGQICKICNQIAIGGALAGVSEAFALARKTGVDAARVREALLGGFAASRVLEVHGGRMLSGSYQPGFRTKLYQKDLRLAIETAAANGGRHAGHGGRRTARQRAGRGRRRRARLRCRGTVSLWRDMRCLGLGA